MDNRTDNQTALAALDRGLSRIDPSLWIAHRQKTLKAEASHMRSGINTAKTLSLGSLAATGGLGLLFGATGIGLVGGGVAGLTYAAVVICDLLDTDRFAPLPFIRTNLGDRLDTLGNADSRALRAEWELAQRGAGKSSFEVEEELYSNLPRELSDEAMMLTKHGALLATLLSQLPFEQRDLAYVRLCASYQTFGDALTGMSLARLQDLVEGRIRGNYLEMKPAEIHSYQAPIYQMPDGRPFGSLPDAPAPILGGTVGSPTRLGAVEIPASPQSESLQTPLNDDLSTETLIALKAYVQQPKNIVMVASGGAGKGITLANLCRFRYEANTAFRVIWFDPKNDPDETGYMAHACIDAIRFNAAELPGEVVVQKVRDMMIRFRDLCAKLPPKTPVWLILDEWYFVLSVLQQYDTEVLSEVIAMLRSTVSLMDAKHKHIVIVGQSPNLDDLLPGQGGLMANLNTLCLFKRDSSGIKLLEKAGQTGVMPRKVATAKRLYAAAAQSPRDRAMFFGDRLWPAPELTNYGNYDRDLGIHLGKAPVTLDSEPVAPAISEPKDFNPNDIQYTPVARQMIAHAYAESNQSAGGVSDKVQRFAEIVAEYWASNPDKASVGLGTLISSHTKLKKVRAEGRKDIIETLMRQAEQAGLIEVRASNTGHVIVKPQPPTATPNDDDLDI